LQLDPKIEECFRIFEKEIMMLFRILNYIKPEKAREFFEIYSENLKHLKIKQFA
jgi:hypothetical protein